MKKADIKKQVKQFKTRIERKNKYNSDKADILNFVHGSTDKVVNHLIELGVQSGVEIKEKLNELVGLNAV